MRQTHRERQTDRETEIINNRDKNKLRPNFFLTRFDKPDFLFNYRDRERERERQRQRETDRQREREEKDRQTLTKINWGVKQADK